MPGMADGFEEPALAQGVVSNVRTFVRTTWRADRLTRGNQTNTLLFLEDAGIRTAGNGCNTLF